MGGRLSYSISRFSDESDLGRTTIYEEIKTGRLKAIKVGARTLITAEEAEAYFKRRAEEVEAD